MTEQQPPDDSGSPDDGVTVSEDFQKQAHALIHKASKHELKHIHDKAYTREDELRQAEQAKASSKGGKGSDMKFTTEGGPISPSM
jgi:hypothetical protein